MSIPPLNQITAVSLFHALISSIDVASNQTLPSDLWLGSRENFIRVKPDKRRMEEEGGGGGLTRDGTKLMHQQLLLQINVMTKLTL